MNPPMLVGRPKNDLDQSKKSVSFAPKLRIREFPIILGDNPSATVGPPICIDWEPQGESTANLDVYEYLRGWRAAEDTTPLECGETKTVGVHSGAYQ
jgi:hypothetical protein